MKWTYEISVLFEINISRLEQQDGPLIFLFLFLKYIFVIRDLGLANSFWDLVIQILNLADEMLKNIFPNY
jgi:hypothetical protein